MTRPVETPLRLAFMGTPDFAVPALAALLDAGVERGEAALDVAAAVRVLR